MRLTVLFGLLSLVFGLSTASNCNYVTLVKCFINILDEWTWTLYELKENVVTISQDQCEHLQQLEKCIKDDGPEQHQCEHEEIVAASNTVSDLLTHRKNSGSFLRSYYLLTYACSTEGQQLLTQHRGCLTRERIGEMTLSAGTYLSEKFIHHSDDQVCTEVNNKLSEYMQAMAGLCEEEASMLMCKSLTNMFKGLHADKLQDCEFTCLKPSTTQFPALAEEAPGDTAIPQPDSLNAASMYSLWNSVLILVPIAIFRQ
uniref:Secreted protein n=1 Tax=Steinernema glaseri TaxID=37863 RepID=A0A1I7XY08_9BILA